MFVFLATIAAFVFAAGQDPGPKDIYAHLGVPRMERCDYKIHVGESGTWRTHSMKSYSIEGVASEDLNDFEEMLIKEATDYYGAQAYSCSAVGENRRQCTSKGRNDDVLKLASLLVHTFEENECAFLRWDRQSFEWKYVRDDDSPVLQDDNSMVYCGM